MTGPYSFLMICHLWLQGSRKIDYMQFKQALKLIADEKKVPLEYVEALLVKAGGPRRNATPADFVRLHDDKSTFTGAR
jgi:p25-alpha